LGQLEGARTGHDAKLLAIGADQADGGNTDLIVDPKLFGQRATSVKR
jgi:hypothetical protein